MKRTLLALTVAFTLTGCGQGAPDPASVPSAGSVNGTVLAAPGCPVERADSPCAPLQVRDADVVASRKGAVVANTRSAADGSFELSLPGGNYTLTATTSGGQNQSLSQAVLVPDEGAVTVTITLDSGIR